MQDQIGTITKYPYRTTHPYNTFIRAHRKDMQNIEESLADKFNQPIDNHTGYLISWWDDDRKVHNKLSFYFSDSETFICQSLDLNKSKDISPNSIEIIPLYHPIMAVDLEPLQKTDHHFDLR